MSRTSAMQGPFPVLPAVCAALLAKLVLLFVFALNTRFVMDEFWQFGQAKYLGHGLFETIWPAKAVGYAVFYKLAHLAGWDGVSMVLAGRLQTALLGCATLAVVYAIARVIGETRLRALAIVLLLLCFSTFMERIFRTRAEPLALFFGASALLVIVRGSADSARGLVVAGILSGLAFLSTQKSLYFNVALGLALLADATLARQYVAGLRRGALLVAGWVLPVALYCVVFGGTEALAVARNVFFGPVEVATTGQTYYESLRGYVSQTLKRNVLLYIACLSGIMTGIRACRSMAPGRRIALVFTLVITVLVFVHNQPWPYVFIMALPFMALWVLGPLDDFTGRWPRVAVVALFAAVVAASFWRNAVYLAHGNAHQLAVIATADSLLPEGAAYFDGIGMLPNRFDTPHVWLDARGVYLSLEGGAESDLRKELEQAPPDLVIRTYRTEALQSVLQPVLDGRYHPVTSNIMLPGRAIDAGKEVVFDAPVAGAYDVYDGNGKASGGRIRVDGAWRDLPVTLTAGQHRLFRAGGGSGAPLHLLPAGLVLEDIRSAQDPEPLFEAIYNF